MGFLSRTLVPRSVRRAVHPVRSAKRVVRKAVVPKSIRKLTYTANQLANPLSSISYHAVERPITTALRSGSKPRKSTAPVYRHNGCSVKHRTPEAAARCRNGSRPSANPKMTSLTMASHPTADVGAKVAQPWSAGASTDKSLLVKQQAIQCGRSVGSWIMRFFRTVRLGKGTPPLPELIPTRYLAGHQVMNGGLGFVLSGVIGVMAMITSGAQTSASTVFFGLVLYIGIGIFGWWARQVGQGHLAQQSHPQNRATTQDERELQ